MAKANRSSYSEERQDLRSRLADAAAKAYNEARPYTDPKADYDTAQQYRQQITDGIARRGQH